MLENEQGQTREEGGQISGILSERTFWVSPISFRWIIVYKICIHE